MFLLKLETETCRQNTVHLTSIRTVVLIWHVFQVSHTVHTTRYM